MNINTDELDKIEKEIEELEKKLDSSDLYDLETVKDLMRKQAKLNSKWRKELVKEINNMYIPSGAFGD